MNGASGAGASSADDLHASASRSARHTRDIVGGPRSGDVRLLWSANASDALGTQLSTVAFPLLLLHLGHSPTTVGLLAGISMLMVLVCGPVVAVAADRGLRKPVMVASAALAAAAMAVVAVSASTVRPPLGLLVSALLVERVATACFESAVRGTVALVSGPEAVVRTVTGLEAGDRAALVIGPALGGVLYQVSRALPFAADAVSYLVTAVCVRCMRSDLRADEPSPGSEHTGTDVPGQRSRTPARHGRAFAQEAAAGIALVWSSSRLRLVLVWTTTVNVALAALYFTVLFSLQHTSGPAAMGLVLALSGAAGLVGALTAPAVVRRLGGTRTLVGVTWLTVVPASAVAFMTGAWGYGICFAALCLILAPATVVVQSAAIADTPPHLQARAGAAIAIVNIAGAALAPVVAGVLVTHSGASATPLACGVSLTLLALLTTARGRHLKTGADR